MGTGWDQNHFALHFLYSPGRADGHGQSRSRCPLPSTAAGSRLCLYIIPCPSPWNLLQTLLGMEGARGWERPVPPV